jgi:hypothetical protein
LRLKIASKERTEEVSIVHFAWCREDGDADMTPFEQLYEKTKAEQTARMAAGGKAPELRFINDGHKHRANPNPTPSPVILTLMDAKFIAPLAFPTPASRAIRESNLDRAFLTASEQRLRDRFNALVLDLQFADRTNVQHLHKCRNGLARVQEQLDAVIATFDAALKPKVVSRKSKKAAR